MSSDRASSSQPRYKKGRILVGGQLMEPADAHGVEIESKGQLDLILESHNFGNLYANSEKPPEMIERKITL